MKVFHLLIIAAFIVGGCNRPTPIDPNANQKVNIDENLAQANKYIVQSEQTQIDGFVQRRGWQMQTLDCGVRLWEYEVGKGAAISQDDHVVIDYRIDGLDGKPFYNHCCDTLIVGRHKPNVGVDAALMKLHHGSKARIIVPSPQGYGVVGDGVNIPTRAVLIYDLSVQ